MLPFLRKKQEAGLGTVLHKTRPSDAPQAEIVDDASAACEACADAIIRAIEMKDAKALVSALQDAFDVMQRPTESDDDSLHAMNVKAAKDAKE